MISQHYLLFLKIQYIQLIIKWQFNIINKKQIHGQY